MKKEEAREKFMIYTLRKLRAEQKYAKARGILERLRPKER